MTTKTLFIIGAGASCEYGLPSWFELAEEIKKYLDSNATEEYKKDILELVSEVENSQSPTSIDQVVYEKLTIPEHEKSGFIINELFEIISVILNDSEIKNWKQKTGWIEELNKKIIGQKYKDIKDNIFFISFNYDNLLLRKLFDHNFFVQKISNPVMTVADRNKGKRDTQLGWPEVQGFHEGFFKTNIIFPFGVIASNDRNLLKHKDDRFPLVNNSRSCYSHYKTGVDNEGLLTCYDKKDDIVKLMAQWFRDFFKLDVSKDKIFNINILGLDGGLERNFDLVLKSLERLYGMHNNYPPLSKLSYTAYNKKQSEVKKLFDTIVDSLKSNKIRTVGGSIRGPEILQYNTCKDLITKY